MMKKIVLLLFPVLNLCCTMQTQDPNTIPLSGTWRVAVDPASEGLQQEWYRGTLPTHDALFAGKQTSMSLNDWMELPGSPDEAGIGKPLIPLSEITPDKEKPVKYYGPYWIQRKVSIPERWGGRSLKLATGKLPAGSDIFWDGELIGRSSDGKTDLDIPAGSGGEHTVTCLIGRTDPRNQESAGGFVLSAGGERLSLDGRWRIVPELQNRNFYNEWKKALPPNKKLHLYYMSYFKGADFTLPDSIDLPGNPADQDIATNLTPSRGITPGLERKYTYDGPYWIQRTVDIPPEWAGKSVRFMIERTVGMCHAYWDGESVGEQHGYDVPQRFLIDGAKITPGEHVLTVYYSRSDHAWPQTGHGVKGENGVNWTGQVGLIQLEKINDLELQHVQVYPDIEHNSVCVKMRIDGGQQDDSVSRLRFSYRRKGARAYKELMVVDLSMRQAAEGIDLVFPEKLKWWDEFNPALYQLRSEAIVDGSVEDVSEVTFGMRRIEATPDGFLLNGKPVMLRGVQQCGAEPIRNYTPMERPYWDRIMRITKRYGMNHMRFHSWCPPRAAFEAADEAGVIFQIEVPHDDINVPGKVRYKELPRMLDEYGNHASFLLLTLGNERFNHDSLSCTALAAAREQDPRHLYACTSHPLKQGCCDDFFISAWGIRQQPKGWGYPIVGIEWGGGDVVSKSRFNTAPPETCYDYSAEIEGRTAPIVTHEVGQWGMFPDFKVLEKYTGTLSNTNFERIRQRVGEKGLMPQADALAKASGRFSMTLYKEEIESVLRTPGLAGFSLLGINDFPGQHLSLVGALDEFWDSKGIITPGKYSEFSRATVPLARMGKRLWSRSEIFEAQVEIAHYGPETMNDARVEWAIRNAAGKTLHTGRFGKTHIPQGGLMTLGKIETALSQGTGAEKLILTISIPDKKIENSWDFWVYPTQVDTSVGNVNVFHAWNGEVEQALASGESVLLIPDRETLRNGYRESCYVPVFWNSIFKWMQKAHHTGLLCEPSHPVFAGFPTDAYQNWQWWDIVMHANAMYINDLPHDLRPLVQVIDSYVFNDRLAYLWECRVGNGKLIVSTIDLDGDLDNRPASRQLKYSLLRYMNGPDFKPSVRLAPQQIGDLFEYDPKLP